VPSTCVEEASFMLRAIVLQAQDLGTLPAPQ
jgi:hypothetical protein